MKKTTLTTWALGILMALTACSAEDPIESYYNQYGNNPGTEGPGGFMGGSTGSATVGSGELVSFDITLDKTTAEPTTTVAEYFPEEEDNLDNNSFTTQVNIDLSNPTAKTENGVTITVNGGHITANHGTTKNICYVVSGTTDNGSFTVMGDKKYEIILNGATIVNPDSAALNLLSGKRAYIVLADGTSNKLTDGTSSKNSHKGTLYCKGKLLFNGSGSLEVYGNYANAIHSADYIVFRKGNNIYAKSTAKNGIKANDGIFINGGILNVEVSAAGAKGINCEDDIIINGGRTSVIATGNGTWDTDDLETKGAAAIKSDSILTVNGGELYLKATGSGGKGLKADWEAYINGGKMRIVTTGNLYYSNGTTENHNYTGNTDNLADAYTSSPKGIKVGTKNVHGVLNITGGDIMVRTSGNNAEGIESKGTLTITSGDIQVSAHDDAINSSSDLTISGGNVVAVGTSNDGIDTNGNLYIKGGTLVAIGSGGAETGIDIDEQHKLYISGGNIFGIGGRIDGNLGSTTQGVATTSGSIQANGTVTIANGSTTLATFNMPPYSYNNGSILVSAPGMTSGSSYTLNLGSQSKTITATNTINSRF